MNPEHLLVGTSVRQIARLYPTSTGGPFRVFPHWQILYQRRDSLQPDAGPKIARRRNRSDRGGTLREARKRPATGRREVCTGNLGTQGEPNSSAASNIAAMFSGGIPAWMLCT